MVLASTSRLSWALYQQRRFQDSARLQKEVFDAYRDLLGATHPTTLSTAFDLAVSLRETGAAANVEAALELAIDVVRKLRTVLDARHPKTHVASAILALILSAANRKRLALLRIDRALRRLAAILGEEHGSVENVRRWRARIEGEDAVAVAP